MQWNLSDNNVFKSYFLYDKVIFIAKTESTKTVCDILCKKRHLNSSKLYFVLTWYSRFFFSIEQIGWRGFGRESVNSGRMGWTILNIVYPVFIVCLLLYTYIYEIVACQWKLDLHKDTQVRELSRVMLCVMQLAVICMTTYSTRNNLIQFMLLKWLESVIHCLCIRKHYCNVLHIEV